MKAFFTFSATLLLAFPLIGQSNDPAPDTLLLHTFEGILDPADTMLAQPNGDDIHWVNYDQDNKTGLCVSNGDTPKGWYWESDLGFVDPNMADNYAFTSCSYLQGGNPQNRNWLITSPVFIPDSSYSLSWRSLSYYGPDYMDGYRVLASIGTNFPADFNDTLFSAAQTILSLQSGSLELNDYLFSDGYIHANGYTKEDYFFVDFEGNAPFYHGKLEPHRVSLAAFAEQTVYLAFLHDSYDDFQVQVDDILVSNQTVSAPVPANFVYFNVLPNPVREFAFVNWKTETPQAGRLSVADQCGKVVFEKKFNARTEGQVCLEAQDFPPGIYFCKLETASGQATKLLVKI
ncbi:MAG: T9SS type A sorting domain-containing protein [Saprospiraceae bacterium]